MAEYSFPHTSVDGDRVVSAAMWRAANRSLGMDGWAYGLAATRNSPTGAVFTVGAGALALDGVVYIADDDVTVTGTVVAGVNAIIAKFGTDRDIVLAHVLDYLNNPPAYDHVLLYLDSQVSTFTLIDKRADSSIAPLQDRAGTVTNAHLAGSITQDKITSLPTTKLTGTITNAQIATGLDASKMTTGTIPSARIGVDSLGVDKLSADVIAKENVVSAAETVAANQTNTYTVAVAGLTTSHICVVKPKLSTTGMGYGAYCSSSGTLRVTVSNSGSSTKSTQNVDLIAIKAT